MDYGKQQQVIVRGERPEPDEARKNLVISILEKINNAEDYWSDTFKRMKADMNFASGKQWPGQTADDDRYVANITHRHIQQRTAQLYARNPKALVKPRKKIFSQAWDGTADSLQMAQMAMESSMMNGMPPPPEAQAVIAEAQSVKQQMELLRRISETLRIVITYEVSEPKPRFKDMAKQAVRRALTTGVAYCKLGYQRISQYPPETDSQLRDGMRRLGEIERLLADLSDKEIDDRSAEYEELKIKMAELQRSRILVRDGLVFGFPRSANIIVDPDCTQLKGFVGASWVAEKFIFTLDRVKERYGIDLKNQKYKTYTESGERARRKNAKGQKPHVCVYEFYDLFGEVMYTVCDGYNDFLAEPGPPNIQLPEQFHPFFVLTFNDTEDDECIYPPSNVQLIRHMNMEINRSREQMRRHRLSSRPATLGVSGILNENDKDKLQTHDDGEHIELTVPRDTDLQKILVAKPVVPVDQNLYETATFYDDSLRVTGDQAANLGGTSGDTATETSIAENSRMSSLDSNKDDLDGWLTEIFSAAGQLLLMEMDPATVKKIAGPGAVWPSLTRQEIAEEVSVELVAGSSGRPNRAMDLSMLERLTPLLVQIPGINPTTLGKRMIPLAFEDADLEEWIAEGLPSIQAINGMTKAAVAPPGSPNPDAQGPQGANNEEAPPAQEGESQGPAYPVPATPGPRLTNQTDTQALV